MRADSLSLTPFFELSEAEKTAAVATQLDLTCEAVAPASTVCSGAYGSWYYDLPFASSTWAILAGRTYFTFLTHVATI